MASKHVIAAAIELATVAHYTAWQIGITNDPTSRLQEWSRTKDVSAWRCWQADSLSDAQDIEAHFIHKKGMKGGTGGATMPGRAVYVYIF